MNISKIMKKKRDAEARLQKQSPTPTYSSDGVNESYIDLSKLATKNDLSTKSDKTHAHEIIDLTDVLITYATNAGKFLIVNATEDGVDLGEASSGGANVFTDLTDTPASYTGQAGKVPVVKATEDGLGFADAPAAANGMPVGGLAGQVLAKIDGTDYNVEWTTFSGGSGFNYIVTSQTSAGIQSAIDLAGADGGGVVLLPPGVYEIIASIEVPSDIKIVGLGEVILKRKAAISSIMINKSDGITGGYEANENIHIENIKFDANNTSIPGDVTSLAFGHAKNIMIKHCEFYGITAWHDLEFNGVRDSHVEGCYFHDYGGTSEMLQLDLMLSSVQFPWFGPYDNTPCENITIDKCVFEGPDATEVNAIGNHSYIVGYQPKYIQISECYFTAFRSAIDLHDVSHFTVKHNTFYDCRIGIRFLEKENPSIDWQILYNTHRRINPQIVYSDRFFEGGDITLSKPFTQVKFIGNEVYNCGTHGIALTVTSDLLMSENTVRDCGDNGLFVYGGSNVVITNNICSGNEDFSNRADIVIGGSSSPAVANSIIANNNVQTIRIEGNTSNTIITGNVATGFISEANSNTGLQIFNNFINGLFQKGSSEYELPQASATVLGGIKAVSKTTGETVEIKIDPSTGKLYAPPPDAATNGLPAGGSTGQILAKASTTDYDAAWVAAPSGGGSSYENAIDAPPAIPSIWDDEFPGPTLDTKWAWANQLGSVAVVNGKLHLDFPTTDGAATLIQPSPTGDFRMTVKLKMWGLVDDYPGFGLTIQNSATNKQVLFELQHRDNAVGYENHISAYRKSVTPGISDVTIGSTEYRHSQYLRMEVVSGVISMKASDGGVFWKEVYSENVSTYINGITDIGIAIDRVGTPHITGWVDWFRVEEL